MHRLVLILASFHLVFTAEFFSAIVDLQRVLYSEQDVAKHLKSYIAKETERLEQLSKIVDDLEEHSNNALENPEKFVSNPVNAFKLVKRFTTDWNELVENYIHTKHTDEFLRDLPGLTASFPDEEDLSGAATALFRLLDTYALDVNQVALGNILTFNNSPPMSALECFELGKLGFSQEDFYHSVLFLNASLNVLDREEIPTVPRFLVLDYLSYGFYKQGNVYQAYIITLNLLQTDPSNERLVGNKKYFEMELKQQDVHAPSEMKLTRPLDEYRMSDEFTNYEKLCRGEKTKSYVHEHKLKCQYRRHHPMFFIKPIKEEEFYLKPRIVVYHGAIYPSEMKLVKQLASPKLNRATVQNSATGQLETASYRVSKSAWLKDTDHWIINRISQRSKSVVNLTLDTVEELQVVNYGIGGHYEPHFDFARKSEINAFDKKIGNRIVTFICYMTNLEAGGSTVFPEIGLELKPQEGSCVVWFNLYRNGDGDYATRHAACPVLVGNKWVANKWFHERGQEFIRPCSLNPME